MHIIKEIKSIINKIDNGISLGSCEAGILESVINKLERDQPDQPKTVQDVFNLFPGRKVVAMNDDEEDRSLYGLSGIFKCTCMVGGKAQDFVVFKFDWNKPLR